MVLLVDIQDIKTTWKKDWNASLVMNYLEVVVLPEAVEVEEAAEVPLNKNTVITVCRICCAL